MITFRLNVGDNAASEDGMDNLSSHRGGLPVQIKSGKLAAITSRVRVAEKWNGMEKKRKRKRKLLEVQVEGPQEMSGKIRHLENICENISLRNRGKVFPYKK